VLKTIIAGLAGIIILLTVDFKAEAQQVNAAIDSLQKSAPVEKKKLSPKKASIYAALFPGLGQVYNGKYWKLPIVYGGYVGLIYIFGWNNNNYNDYSQAYRTISKYESAADMTLADRLYLENFIKNPSINLENPSHFTYVTTSLKSGKDFYRRNRDLTIIGVAALHILSIIDASVDANLSDFDISNDLSLKVEPANINLNGQNPVLGLNLVFNF
jgi:hypothetical protein